MLSASAAQVSCQMAAAVPERLRLRPSSCPLGVSQQCVSAIESGGVAELATLADYIHALGGELKVIAEGKR